MEKSTKTAIYFYTLVVFGLCLVQAVSASVRGEKKTKERQFLSKWSGDSIFKKEIIIGGSWSDEKGEVGGKNSVGFEFLKKFSNEKGDWGSFLIQMRLVRYDRQSTLMNQTKMLPAHVDGTHNWELEFHDIYFKYSGPFKGKFNIRVGHFDVPFGLEQNVDTHSSLIQIMSMRNVGFKKDWGIAVGGQLPEMDYEFAFTRGTGVEYRERGENYLLSGRVGTPADRNFSIGLSGLYGQVIDSMGVMRGKRMGMPSTWFGSRTKPKQDIIKRSRVGLDCIYLSGPYTFKGELSYGKDENQSVINTILELDYLFPDMDGRLEAIVQIQNSHQDLTATGSDDDTFLTLGLNYRLSREMTLQTMYRHDFQRIKKTKNDNILGFQLYTYF
ncbi:MAG: hypothetical protein GWP15_04190 [Nitrospirae bacterium]|nr:hypothetical protein [Nitrospirota bacterium]